MAPMSEPASIVVRRRVEWADTDASGKYHNTVAFRLAEQAETRLLEALGMLEEVYGRLPRVHMSVDLTEALRFNDQIDVELRVEDVGRTSISYAFDIRKDGRAAAAGQMIAVLLEGPGEAEEWSDRHREVLTTAGPQSPS
jgi:acyl-CoA thioester hydrolase